MPPPTTLVLAQLLTSTLSNDSSVAELLRRQATFLEDTTLPAALQARGAAIFHHALFTETPNAIHAGESVVEILRKTIVRIGELYLENERGPVVKSEGGDGVGVEVAAKEGSGVHDEDGVRREEAARMGQAKKDDRRTAEGTSARAGRKRTRDEQDEDSSVDDPDSNDFNAREAESQRATDIIAVRPNRQIHDKISALVAANTTKTLPARIALEKKRSERAKSKASSSSTFSEPMAPFTDTAAQSTSASSTDNTNLEGSTPLTKSRSKRNTSPPPKRFGTHRKRRVRAPPTFLSRALPTLPAPPAIEQPKPSLIVVLSIPHLGAVVKTLGSKEPAKKKRKKVKKSELSSEFIRDEDEEEEEE
jgi:hypothetical protein